MEKLNLTPEVGPPAGGPLGRGFGAHGQQRSHSAYWKRYLKGAPALLHLPADRSRPAGAARSIAAVDFELGSEVYKSLRELIRRSHATLFMTAAAAFCVQLGRYSGQEDVCVGYPASDHAGGDGLNGAASNTLMLRAWMSPRQTFGQLLEQVRFSVLEAEAHRGVTFEELIEGLLPEDDSECPPLPQVVLEVDDADGDFAYTSQAGSGRYERGGFDLRLVLCARSGQLRGSLQYDTSIFNRATVERMAGHFKTLLRAVSNDPEQRISQLPLLTDEERRQLLVEWNDTRVELPANKCLHQLFEEQAARTPDAVAVLFEEQQLSYGELNERANRLAHYLRELGVGPEALVGLCVERSPEMLVGLLAVWKAGGAYVPIDPEHPAERISYILRDTGAPVLLTQARLKARLPEHGARLVCLDEDWPVIAQHTAADAEHVVRTQNLAYCVYTSGSTGEPKAVAIPHSNIVNHILHMKRALEIQASDRVFQFTSLNIDACLEEIFPAWLAGATLILQSGRMLSDREFLRTLNDRKISVLSLPTSYWHHLVEEMSAADAGWPEALRMVFVGGEKVLAEKFRRWKELTRGRDVVWVQDYGPSEGTISCTMFTPDLVTDWDNVPIGRPISNEQIYILDSELNPVPVGVAGELCIGGAGLARGYLNRPGLTAEKFIPNPYGEPGSRIYRTGDLGRYLPDGNIQFIGRVDQQVKILGHRIELGEIETALLRCEGVREAAVVSREDTPGDIRLTAYVVADNFDEASLRKRLSETLPAVMVPAAFVPLAELPLSTVTGKLDRSRLPAPNTNGHKPSLSEASELERALAGLWAEAVERPPSSLDEDFFLSGGDSLRALRLLGRLSDLTGLNIEFAEFFQTRTLRSLAASLLRLSHQKAGSTNGRDHASELARRIEGGAGAQGPKLRRGEGALRAASNAQQRLWFLNQFQAGAATYSVPLGYRIRGDFSIERLDAALTEIVARHEALRTGLVMRDGVLWQEIAPPMPFRSERLQADSFEEAMRRAHAEASIAFDLTRPPLLRSICIRFAPDELLFVLIVHHAVCDAWSLGIFWRELTALYGAEPTAEPSLPAPEFHYADYVDWQREWLKGAGADAQRTFWREQLAGELPLLRLNPDLPTDAPRSDAGGFEALRMNADLCRAVSETAAKHGTTDFVIILSAFLATLHRYTRHDQILVGVPVACRSFPDTERVIGYFSNTLALRAFFPTGLSFSELVEQTSKALSDAMTHQELPFDEVVNSLELARQLSSNPVFQAMFVMQTTPADGVLRLDGVELEEVIVHSGTSKVDVTCAIRAGGGGLEGELEYSTDVLSRPAASRFVSAFLNLLSDSTRRPSARLDELTMVSDEERAALVAAATARFEVYPDFQPIHVHFEAQARRVPEALAVEYGGQTISYGELNARANRLARRLMEAGVAPESLVGICVERSFELVVALLATLKAGAGFVPLDTNFPVERIRKICEDASARLVITQERQRSKLAALPTPLLVEQPGSNGVPDQDPCVPTSPENIAYVYYTSGSTGIPKGVIIDHQCAMNRLEWLRRRYPLGVGDRVLHKTPLIFDVAIWEIFGPLMAGATVLMADAGAESDVSHIARLLSTRGPIFAHFVPSMLDSYLNFAPPANYPNLRWVQLSGEAVSARLLERFAEHFSAEFHNCYGQTETSEVAAWEGSRCEGTKGVPIGRQIGIYRLHILDKALNPVPVGVPGELCVAGLGGLARGYHARPGLTAEKFVPNPYAVEAGERLYRTGDLARLTEEGVIEYVGRIDHQVKIRGCRVETSEVESVLARHASVRACAVVARADDSGASQLFAYVVSENPSAAELGAHAERFLPKYMLPAAYIFLKELPLTPSGKLDRLRLPAPKPSDFEARVSEDGPQSALEEELVELWKQVLGLEKVGRADNFFVIGGNSLKSMQVLARLKARFGVEVSVRNFFASPTVEGLASYIEKALMEMVTSLSDAEAARRLEELGA